MQFFRNVWVLARATYIEGIRHRALWGILGLAVILTMGNVVFTSMFSWDLGKISIEFGLSAVSFSGLLLVFFLGLKILADDLERNRIYMILSRPVTIREYLLGKFAGLALILLASTLILASSASCSMLYVLHYYPAFVPPNFSWLTYLMALSCQFLGLLVVQALCVFWFSLASHSFIALLLTALSYFLGQNIETLRYVIEKNTSAGVLAGQDYIVKIISWILPNLSLFDKKYHAAYGLPFSLYEFSIITSYGVSYIAILLWLAVFLYKRKELAA